MTTSSKLSENLARLQKVLLLGGAIGLLLLAIGWIAEPKRFYEAYLMAYLYWLGPTLGSMAVIMLHNMTGGAWGFTIRRLLEAGMRNVPWMALLFLPIAIGIPALYMWSHPDIVASDPVLQWKARYYLNVPFFLARAVVYFAAWTFFAFGIIRLSARYDRSLSIKALRRMKVFAGLGLVTYVLTMTFASFDWAMSLEPNWSSTIYGAVIVVGQVLTTFALAIVITSRLVRYEPFSRWIEPSHFHDLGNLMLAFVMLWAYLSFSQFLIIWSGNLPEETPWYLHRVAMSWQTIAILLIVLHFAAPLLLLLSRRRKRNARSLALLACGLLVMRYVEVYWLVAPAFTAGSGPDVSWLDVVAPLAFGSLWLGLFIRNLRGRPLVSLQDAKILKQLEEAPAS